MKKERINEIKKGLENDIYRKIKDIQVEKKEEYSKFNPEYIPTDSLADILPLKEEANDTMQIVDKDSIDLELDRGEILKKYGEYIYDNPSEQDIESSKEESSLEEIKNSKENPKSVSQNELEPMIPKFQTEEHLEQIAAEINEVEQKYDKEEELMLEVQSEEDSSKTNTMNNNYQPESEIHSKGLEKEDYDGETIIAPQTSYEYISHLNQVEENVIESNEEDLLDLTNDFQEEDQIIIPLNENEVYTKKSPIEDSQFIFEQDVEEEEEFEKSELDLDEGNSSYEDTTEFEMSTIFKEVSEEDDFWEEEEQEEEKKYVDVILFITLIILLLIVIYMVV